MLKTLDAEKASVGSVGKILTEDAVDLDVDEFLTEELLTVDDKLLTKELFAEDVVTLDVEKILTEEEVDAVIVLQPEVFLILHVATDFKLPQISSCQKISYCHKMSCCHRFQVNCFPATAAHWDS